MPNLITELVVDRVDLVEEGANSAAFIELYKGKEHTTDMTIPEIIEEMKPEQAEVIKSKITEGDAASAKVAELETTNSTLTSDLAKANDKVKELEEELAKAKTGTCNCDGEADEKGICKRCGLKKAGNPSFDEAEVLKSIPDSAKAYIEVLKTKAKVAEDEVRKSKEAAEQQELVAKAAVLKNLPVDQEKLVGIIKGISKDAYDLLVSANEAIGKTLLGEVGSNGEGVAKEKGANSAWAKIDKEATKVAKEQNITIAKATAIVIKEKPELYEEYLKEGAN